MALPVSTGRVKWSTQSKELCKCPGTAVVPEFLRCLWMKPMGLEQGEQRGKQSKLRWGGEAERGIGGKEQEASMSGVLGCCNVYSFFFDVKLLPSSIQGA